MKISLQRRHAPTVRNGALSHKIDYISNFKDNQNLKGYQYRNTGSRVMAILLNMWIFPIRQSGEASRCRVSYQRGLPRLVSQHLESKNKPPFCIRADVNYILMMAILHLSEETKLL